MHIDRLGLIGLTLGFSVMLAGCGDDGDDGDTGADTETSDTTPTTTEGATETATPTTGEETDTMAETTGDMPGTCEGAGQGSAAEGDACTANSDCESGVCQLFNDVPPNDDATCAPTPEDCATRVTGTLKDFTTGAAVSGVDVNVLKALDAITNPAGATPIATATADADGKVDTTTDGKVNSAIGIIAVAGGGDYYLTATGVSAPAESGDYPVGVGIHEYWAVPSATLTQWSDVLGMDAEVPADKLPLGDTGGIVGFVRDGSTGDPIEGAVVQSTSDTSPAVIRYLQDDGSFTADATGPSGIFVVVNPAPPSEDFEALVDGSPVGGGTAGSANNVVFTLVISG